MSGQPPGPRVLIVEDDPGLASQMRWALPGYDIAVAGDREAALALLGGERPAVVILDLGLPPDPNGPSEGFAVLEAVLAACPTAKIIVATGQNDGGEALRAVGMGAYDFFPKPVDPEALRHCVARAANHHRLEEELRRVERGRAAMPLAGVVAQSPEMLKLCRAVERIAPTDVGVMVTGESGTGKELIARAIHDLSPRRPGPFIAINCAAIPETLLESELFGHEKGAFTGAVRQTVGKVEQADGGTLFLDEIGDMPLSLQAKMLRFLEGRTIERVGGRAQIPVDVRIVAATNRDLAAMMGAGTFREDLFYRLNEVGLHIPPLRERPGDAVLIASHLLRRFRQGVDAAPRGFAPDALAAIAAHPWPGNVRELANRVKRAVVLADAKLIAAADLDLAPVGAPDAPPLPTLRQVRDRADSQAVAQALALAGNNVSEAARLLGVSRPTLYDLMRTLDIGPIPREPAK